MIAVIGLGNAGLPLAATIAENGIEVIGIDVDGGRCEEINRGVNPLPLEAGLDELVRRHGGKGLKASADYERAKDCMAFIVIVPLFVDDNQNPDFSVLENAFRSVGKLLKRGDLVVLETSVPPGTTEKRVRRWLEEESGLTLGDFHLANSPERIMSGYCLSRLREFPKVVGGVDERSGLVALEVYKKFIPNISLVSSARAAEMIKLMEGCYRDVNVALANELFKISEVLDLDFYEARRFANHEYCEIHLPSTGVGGHCIPVYPWFLIKEMERREAFGSSRLLRTAREINDAMVEHWAERIILEGLKVDRPLNQVKICVKGITYRPGVKGLYHSRNLALARLLMDKGLRVTVCDELFTPEDLEALGLVPGNPADADISFDPFGPMLEKE